MLIKNKLKAVRVQVKTMRLFGEETDLSVLSRTLLKTIMREKLIQKFVAKLSKRLDEQAEEYREISELAEKLAQTTQGIGDMNK